MYRLSISPSPFFPPSICHIPPQANRRRSSLAFCHPYCCGVAAVSLGVLLLLLMLVLLPCDQTERKQKKDNPKNRYHVRSRDPSTDIHSLRGYAQPFSGLVLLSPFAFALSAPACGQERHLTRAVFFCFTFFGALVLLLVSSLLLFAILCCSAFALCS
jgi:hypothetical protein